jgi:hypothetical protein
MHSSAAVFALLGYVRQVQEPTESPGSMHEARKTNILLLAGTLYHA